MRHGSGPHIPQPLHYFENEGSVAPRAYFVMEHIEFTHPSLITDLPERTARALEWLSDVPAPPEDVVGPSKNAIGPVGGGRIRHRLFKDDEAPLTFSSVDALERYMNEAWTRMVESKSKKGEPSDLGDKLQCMNSSTHAHTLAGERKVI
ncbi:hypothetical protein Clacol_004174 [Clathrus columnatus]|uniref:Uncharacterized protein n=1 Tax=Clathrus columnatus TaxID=1419009 RepID=A0AAV5AAL1_9AGAM|nr:hypothetical protein Clacol_004174 [Clathrus columnatus]